MKQPQTQPAPPSDDREASVRTPRAASPRLQSMSETERTGWLVSKELQPPK
jgi:hypothetical protein